MTIESNQCNKSLVRAAQVPAGIATLVLVCFFLSGLTGLIYEILWTRMIVKVIGSAPFAVSIILTIFMGGLGLGSLLASRRIDRVEDAHKLLRIYALLELVIGGYAAILPRLIIACKPFYQIIYNQLFNHFLVYSVLTLMGCLVLLIIPVICMGATLPVLCRFYVVQLSHLGTRAGRLYGLNTIGAAAGSFLCGFWLITYLGVWGTLSFAVLLNGLIGGICFVTSYWMRKEIVKQDDAFLGVQDSISHGQNIQHDIFSPYTPFHAAGALAIFGVSGFCAMAYEVIWTKLLGLIIGPTIYSFTIVLTTFIIGLALGSLIFGWLCDKTKKSLLILISTQLIAALLALVVSQVLGNSQFFFAKLIYHFQARFEQLAAVKAGILFVFMLGPTLCLGATFPCVGKICTRSLTQVGRSIGFAYAINTLGAVLGSFCAGFLLIPWFGKEMSLSLVIGTQLIACLMVGGYLFQKTKIRTVYRFSFGITTLLGIVLCFYFPQWNRQLLSLGRYHRFEYFSSELRNSGWLESLWSGTSKLAKYQNDMDLIYYGDGVGGFTTVMRSTDVLGVPEYFLFNSGKGDASSRRDMPTQTLLAHLPLLFHPNPQEILVVGLASGVTAGEVLHYPVESIDIVEISEQVVAASDFFVPWNNKVLSNPKTELIIQDARAHLELTERKYDVIISEPSNPWMAGLANLFTKECFILARNRLKQGGVFVQWVHSYQMDWSTFSLIGRTFSEVFPQSILMTTFPGWSENRERGTDFLMIGFQGKKSLDLGTAKKNIIYTEQSKNIILPDPRIFYRLIVNEDLKRLFGDGPLHSDNGPLLEFAAPKQMYLDDSIVAKNIMSRKWLGPQTKAVLEEIANVEQQIAFAAFAFSIYQPFNRMVDFGQATPTQKESFLELIEDYCAHSVISDFSVFADQSVREKCISMQIKSIQNNIHLVPDKAVAYSHLGNTYSVKGNLDQAIENYQKALAINPRYEKVLCNLGDAYIGKKMFDEAISACEKAIKLNPSYAKAYYNLGAAYASQGRMDEAITNFKRAITVEPYYAKAQYNLGIAYYFIKNFKLAKEHLGKAIELGYSVNPELLKFLKSAN
jgi:spermidine synthase